MYGWARAVAVCAAGLVFLVSAHPAEHSLRHRSNTKTLGGHAFHASRSLELEGALEQKPVSDATLNLSDPERKIRYEKLGWFSLYALCIFVFVGATFKLVSLIIAYRSNLKGYHYKSFMEYLTYSLETWFMNTNAAGAKVIIWIFLLTVLVGALLAGTIMGHKNPFTSLWYVCSWVLDPGSAFGLEDHHILAQFLSGALGIGGILMLALLLTLMQDGFNSSMEKLKKGESPVIESGHIMIIGYTEQAPSLLQELCQAHRAVGGTSIVVMSDQHTKSEMDAAIAAAEVQTMGSMIVTRCGKPHSRSDLRHVAAHTAQTVILLPRIDEDQECRDAFMLRTLIILRGQGWPYQGRIVAVCSLIRNLKLFQDVGGDVTDIVMVENFMAKIMTRCSRHPGLSSTLSEIFSSGGSDFIIGAVPKCLKGMPFSKACDHYPFAVPVGVLGSFDGANAGTRSVCANFNSGNHSCHLCPGGDFTLEEGQEIVFLAAEPAATRAVPDAALTSLSVQQKLPRSPKKSDTGNAEPETILMLGWNELAGNMILELDGQVARGSELIIVAEVSKEERQKTIEQMQDRYKKRVENMSISQSLGRISSGYDLDAMALPVNKTSRIFFLADTTGESSEHVDACTVTAILQIRDMLLEAGISKNIAIIPEIKDPLSRTLCANLKITDFIDTSGLPSKVLAMVACQPRIQLVLNEIISQSGRVHFSVQRLETYVDKQSAPTSFSFRQVQALVGSCGAVAIGWSKPFSQTSNAHALTDFGESVEFHSRMAKICKEAHGKSAMIEYELNPEDKTGMREWSWEDDKIVVLSSAGV